MSLYVFRQDHSAAELRAMARKESGSVCQRMLLIANLLDKINIGDAARLAGMSAVSAYSWHNRYEEEGVSLSNPLISHN